jgi:hypothetical protein
MPLSVLVALALTAPALEIPVTPAGAQSFTVGVYVTPTQFHAHNFADDPRGLLFRRADALEIRVLAPGADVEWDFPSGTLSGMELEVVSKEQGLWNTSGALALDDVIALGGHTLWIESQSTSGCWMQGDANLTPFSAAGEMLPPNLTNSPDGSGSNEPLFHVPGVTPDLPPDLPPNLPPKPLPPF